MRAQEVAAPFSDAFFAITVTMNASADGLDGDELPISIEEVCDVPEALATEAAQLVGGDGIGIISADTHVFDAGEAQRRSGDHRGGGGGRPDAQGEAQASRRVATKREGWPVPTFDVSRADRNLIDDEGVRLRRRPPALRGASGRAGVDHRPNAAPP